MTPEVALLIAKAHSAIERAERMLSVELYEDAGRSAYLAGYHAAQAVLFTEHGKVAKTHSGLLSEFARLGPHNRPRICPSH